MLLLEPMLLAGLVAMTTLFATQGTLGALRSHRRIDRLLNRLRSCCWPGARHRWANLRLSHVTEDELRQPIRLAGVASLDDVLGVVLERSPWRGDGATDPPPTP